eukprot:Hpha_TRINITY_DN31893_c0_g1::TRINITY_DN31893_c0_g1_i2::g.29981::m.29981
MKRAAEDGASGRQKDARVEGREDCIEAGQAAKAAFAKVAKNKVAAITDLCQQAQRIERIWDTDTELRCVLLGALSHNLGTLEGHKQQVCRELASLAPKVGPESTKKHFLTIVLPIERQHTRGLRDHEFMVLRPDDLSKKSPAEAGDGSGSSPGEVMPLTVVLDNLRSAFNVGSIFRTSECLRAERLVLCGYTAVPDDGNGQTKKAAMGTEQHVAHSRCESTHEAVKELKARGVRVYALETVEGAHMLHHFSFPRPCALLLGNERHGIEADLLALCDGCVRIPCRGVKNSLNVGVAFAVAAYEMARQW